MAIRSVLTIDAQAVGQCPDTLAPVNSANPLPVSMVGSGGVGNGLSAKGGLAVTPSDSTNLTVTTTGLYIGVGGNVKVTMLNGDTPTYVGVLAGVVYPWQVTRVWATGTTATSIVANY